MNLSKLIRKGRLDPIHQMDKKGIWIIGYRRKETSRKAGKFFLKRPILVEPVKEAA